MPTATPDAVKNSVQRVLSEDVLTLREACNELALITRRRPDKTTLYRWCFKGVGGVKLDFARVGVQILTSRQALTRFIEARSSR